MGMNVSKFNFTKSVLEKLSIPEQGSVYHYDLKVSGLGIRVAPSGKKTFVLYRKINGVPKRITLGPYPDLTIERARTKASALNVDIANGGDPVETIKASKHEMTLDDLFQGYMTNCAVKNKRPDKPMNNYRLYLSHWGKRKLSNIKQQEVRKLHLNLGNERGTVTANIALKLLHVMFNKGINEFGLWKGENPAHGIKKFPEKSRERFLQKDELPRFFQALASEENEIMREYFFVSLFTGARRSNVLSMRWEDISFEREEWVILETKNGKPQTVTLSPEVMKILRNSSRIEKTGFVFPGSGKTGHLVEPKKAWNRLLERAGFNDLRIHDLRRTFGSWQARSGASLLVIGKSLNHQSSKPTEIYARLDLDPVRESVNMATSAMVAAGGVNILSKDDPSKMSDGGDQ